MSRLIVKNIPKHLSEAQLKTIFEKQGEVTDVKIIFKDTLNRRFCYVGYKSEESAQKALKYFNNSFINTSKVQVAFAKTLDDPTLPRPWSKYSKGSSQYNQKFGIEPALMKKTKVEKQHQQQQPQTKEEQFELFKSLMKNQNAATMSWNDTLDVGSLDNPKMRQKMLKELKKQKAKADKQELDEIFDKVAKNPNQGQQQQLQQQQQQIEENGMPINEKRLYVTNIPFNSNEGEVRQIFEKFGTVIELKLPKGKGGVLTGYCFVSYNLPEEAMRAFSELNNKIVMGRILHVRPAFEEDKKIQIKHQEQTEKSSFKKSKKTIMLQKLEDSTNWNTLFLNPNSILEAISVKYGVKKREILSDESDQVAVRIAMAETQIIKETKEWLKQNKIDLSFLKENRAECIRSKNTILVKNLQYKVDVHELHELFNNYGKVRRILLSPNKSIGIVSFDNEQFAQNAFNSLSYYKFKGSLLYLEWAPITFEGYVKAKQAQIAEEQNQEQDQALSKILYVKNLNFSSTEKDLFTLFSEYNIKKASIVKRDGLSSGYGFLEFDLPENAGKAIRQMQNVLLDGHTLQLSQSKPKAKTSNLYDWKIQFQGNQKKQREELQPSTKIIIRNIPFEANEKELKQLLKAYGEVKKVRLPKKLNNQHRGFAFAEFISLEEAQNAYEALQSTHFYGRKLVIEYSYDDVIKE